MSLGNPGVLVEPNERGIAFRAHEVPREWPRRSLLHSCGQEVGD